MPVLTLEKKTVSTFSLVPALRSVSSALRLPFRIPAWAVAAALIVVGVSAFAAGRMKPKHHYVKYFGPMVLDTTTGKACYAVPPKGNDGAMQDAAFAIDGADSQPAAADPNVPMCGNE